MQSHQRRCSSLLLNTVPGVQKEYQAIRAVPAKEALKKA